MTYKKARDFLKSQTNLPKNKKDNIVKELWERKKIFVLLLYSKYFDYETVFRQIQSGKSYQELRSTESNLFENLVSNTTEIPLIEEERFTEILKSFLSVGYLAPRTPTEIREHISCLALFYNEFEEIQSIILPNIAYHIDYVTSQLAARVFEFIDLIDREGIKTDRTDKSTKSLRGKKGRQKQRVIGLYNTIRGW